MDKRTVQAYRGSCHCGAVTFEIETDFPELTTCDCSTCRRKNAPAYRCGRPWAQRCSEMNAVVAGPRQRDER